MQFVGDITEDQVIFEFLNAEKSKLNKPDKDFISGFADFENNGDNLRRRNLLAVIRGYPDKWLFEKFPNEIRWVRMNCAVEELKNVKYISQRCWIDFSAGTRLASDSLKNFGKFSVNGVDISKIKNITAEIEKGSSLPRMIFVSINENSFPVVMEGHHRLTAYLLAEQNIVKSLEIIIGYSAKFVQWNYY